MNRNEFWRKGVEFTNECKGVEMRFFGVNHQSIVLSRRTIMGFFHNESATHQEGLQIPNSHIYEGRTLQGRI